jgi:hypothetical protein
MLLNKLRETCEYLGDRLCSSFCGISVSKLGGLNEMSWLTNSALVFEPNFWGRGGLRGFSE